MPESNVDDIKVINDYGNFVRLTHYPKSQIFCAATPWEDGAQVMGDELMDELAQEYDFTW